MDVVAEVCFEQILVHLVQHGRNSISILTLRGTCNNFKRIIDCWYLATAQLLMKSSIYGAGWTSSINMIGSCTFLSDQLSDRYVIPSYGLWNTIGARGIPEDVSEFVVSQMWPFRNKRLESSSWLLVKGDISARAIKLITEGYFPNAFNSYIYAARVMDERVDIEVRRAYARAINIDELICDNGHFYDCGCVVSEDDFYGDDIYGDDIYGDEWDVHSDKYEHSSESSIEREDALDDVNPDCVDEYREIVRELLAAI
jgi:hypothetical protein